MATNEDIPFDFGFTAVDESDLEVSKQVEELATTQATTEQRLHKLYKAITPLLNNLKKNPEKDYIKWPNRVGKIEEFESMIANIVYGD